MSDFFFVLSNVLLVWEERWQSWYFAVKVNWEKCQNDVSTVSSVIMFMDEKKIFFSSRLFEN